MQNPFEDMVREVDRFMAGRAQVHVALARVTSALREAGVEFALAGGLALGRHGYLRVTVDVDLLITAEGLTRFKQQWLGRGFVEKFPGSTGVREIETGVAIDFLVAGGFPGDGKPKAIRFPSPDSVAIDVEGMRVVDLRTLIELKLASGLSAADRLRDLADVIELIRANRLREEFSETLDASVCAKYLELWTAAQLPPREL